MHTLDSERSAPPGGTRSASGLRFATWNIHSGVGSDERMDLDRIVSVIETIDADVIGLQEVGWHRSHHARIDQFAYLRERTDYHVVEGLVRDPLRSRFGNALLSRLPVASVRWIDLKILGHAPRGAIAVDLLHGATRLRVVVAHFGLSPPEREIQAARIIEAIAPDAVGAPPVVILGDFNIVREWTRASRLLRGHLAACVSAPTYPAWRPLFALDRIYLSAHWTIQMSHVLRTDLAMRASDHLPLMAEAALTPSATTVDLLRTAGRGPASA